MASDFWVDLKSNGGGWPGHSLWCVCGGGLPLMGFLENCSFPHFCVPDFTPFLDHCHPVVTSGVRFSSCFSPIFCEGGCFLQGDLAYLFYVSFINKLLFLGESRICYP